MTITQFIRNNRKALDKHIQKEAPGSPQTDTERELWINNDEVLYRWAIAEGAYPAA